MTTESLTEGDNINAFIDVLKCTKSEAMFYLESAAWNIETAVMLWLENNPNSHSYGNNYGTLGYNNYLSSCENNSKNMIMSCDNQSRSNNCFNRVGKPKFYPRKVVIQGLPDEWRAKVSKYSGLVYFIHVPTGTKQNQVPPGFADASDKSEYPDVIDMVDDDSEEIAGNLSANITVKFGDNLYPLECSGGGNTSMYTTSHFMSLNGGRVDSCNNRSQSPPPPQVADCDDGSSTASSSTTSSDSDSGNGTNKAQWDEGSGYSLANEPNYSVRGEDNDAEEETTFNDDDDDDGNLNDDGDGNNSLSCSHSRSNSLSNSSIDDGNSSMNNLHNLHNNSSSGTLSSSSNSNSTTTNNLFTTQVTTITTDDDADAADVGIDIAAITDSNQQQQQQSVSMKIPASALSGLWNQQQQHQPIQLNSFTTNTYHNGGGSGVNFNSNSNTATTTAQQNNRDASASMFSDT